MRTAKERTWRRVERFGAVRDLRAKEGMVRDMVRGIGWTEGIFVAAWMRDGGLHLVGRGLG